MKIKKSKIAKKRGQNQLQMDALKKAQKNRIGKPVSGKTKDALKLGPISMIGKPKSDLTKGKISQSKKGEKNYMCGISQDNHLSSRKVRNLLTGEIYPSAKQCAIKLKKSYVHINMILRGLGKNTLEISYIN